PTRAGLRSGSFVFDRVEYLPDSSTDDEHAACRQWKCTDLRVQLKVGWMSDVHTCQEGARLVDDVHLLWHKRSSVTAWHGSSQLYLAHSKRSREALSRTNQ